MGPLVLALPGMQVEAVARLATVQTVLGSVALLWCTTRYVARLRPLHDLLVQGGRQQAAGPGPGQTVLDAAFHGPDWVVLRVTGMQMLAPALDAVGLVSITGLAGWQRLCVDLLALAMGTAGMLPSILLWRRQVWNWLGRLHPHDVTLPALDRLCIRQAYTVALPVGMVGLASLSVLIAHQQALERALRASEVPGVAASSYPGTWMLVLGLLAVVFSTTLAWLVSRRLGQRSADDLRQLTSELHRLRRRRTPSTDGQLSLFTDIPTTVAGHALGGSLRELARCFSSIAEQELQARQALGQARRTRTRFLASMSHDLRSPLNSIVGFSELVASEAEGPLTDAQRESVQLIVRSARDLLRLVQQILDWARLDAGKLVLEKVHTPAAALLVQAVSEGEQMLEGSALGIQADLPAGLPEVEVDPERFVQAVMGLFTHASYVMEAGAIQLGASVDQRSARERYLRIDVTDTGEGIREADQPRLFEPFRDIQEPSGRRIGGLGLGLSLARDLVVAQGGELWFVSRPGQGTTFTIAFPLDA